MAQAKAGDGVKVHYKGTFDSGEVFDTSEGRDPLEFNLGSGMVIPGFDDGVVGMEVGEKKSIKLPPEEAYGTAHEELVQKVPRNEVPAEIDIQVGMRLQAQGPGGQPFVVVVTEVTDEEVTVDGNHPMAGKTLNFDLELVEICEPFPMPSSCGGSCSDGDCGDTCDCDGSCD